MYHIINLILSIYFLEMILMNSQEKTIQDTIKDRQITKLIHVTDKDNVVSIKKYGLLPVTDLKSKKISYSFNDNQRLDFFTDAVCLSVTSYNKFLFNSFQEKFKTRKYVVLEIDPKILYDTNIKKLFFDYNAAASTAECSRTNMEIMFKDELFIKSADIIKTRDDKAKNEPTSCQAEILYFGKINPKYILNIYDLGN